jgi:hypothetical protein
MKGASGRTRKRLKYPNPNPTLDRSAKTQKDGGRAGGYFLIFVNVVLEEAKLLKTLAV